MADTTLAVRIREFGGPEVMKLDGAPLPPPGPGEVRVRHTAIGLNYIDIYQRRGTYPLPLPTGLGHEAAAVVEAVGPEVREVRVGDRVAYMNAGVGAYAERRNIAAGRLVALPPGVSDENAAALLFKGLTAQYLLKRTYAVKPGDLVLVHAAAGGVGQILCRWAKALGATVIGTAGSVAKCEIARAAGCEVAVDYSRDDWPATLLAATGGRKAQVVYDAVGQHTFLRSLDCTAPFGLVVLYGAASGPAPAIDPELLNRKGCLYLTRPSVFSHNAEVATFRANTADLFAAVAASMVQANIGARYPLKDVAAAHAAAESRAIHGATVLLP